MSNDIKDYSESDIRFIRDILVNLLDKIDDGELDEHFFNQELNDLIYVLDNPHITDD